MAIVNGLVEPVITIGDKLLISNIRKQYEPVICRCIS